jgi:putative transposase
VHRQNPPKHIESDHPQKCTVFRGVQLLNEEMFDSLEDARRKLALWRYDYNNVRPHSSLGNQTPAEARRTLEQFEGSAPDALAQTDNEEYEKQTRRLSL